MEKGIQNADTVAYKLRRALIRAINHKLKVARKKPQKRVKIVERRKIKAMAVSHQRARSRINLSSEEEENYESDTGDKTDPYQAGNDKNSLQLWEGGVGGSC